MAGYNNGFFMSSADGNFKLEVGALIQVRWVMNDAKGYQPAPNVNTKQNTEYGFENSRTQLNFSGNVVDPSWTYRVRLDMGAYNGGGDAGGFAELDFAYVQKTMDNGFSFRLGQFRAPWMREMLVEDGHQLAVDRSVLAAYFGQGFSQGLGLGYAQENWKVDAYYGNGIYTGVTGGPADGNGSWSENGTNWSVAGRFEYLIKGNWDQFADESSFRGEDFGVMVGVAGVAQRYDNQITATAPASALSSGDKTYGITADVTMDFGGANMSAAFVWARQDPSAANTDSVSPYGFNIQGGYFVTDDIEVFGRYDYVDYKTTTVAAFEDTSKYSGVTLGANWYLAGHNAKLTVDWSMNLKSFGDNQNLTSYGWRQDGFSEAGGAGGTGSLENNQWALRAQMQLMF
jgi:hypothetical protein